jgi:TolB-like protein
MKSFLEELRRRKVFRVAVVYAATGFVVLQAADLILPRLGVPEWAMSLIVVLLLLGFPVALALGWALELTPEGVRVTDSTSPATRAAGEPLPSLLGRRTMVVAGALVVLGTGLGAGLFLAPTALHESHLAGGAGGGLPVADRSVAVLPFSDLSEAADQKWFADGLAEEILISLSRVPELRVVGRSSSFLFAAGTVDDRIIADTLGVAHLVKGTVRRVGNNLRVSAQLVRAADGVQLWSEAYDRDAAALLDVQRDVAERVVAALDVLLDDARRDRMFASGTRSVAAFEAYAHGRQMLRAAHYGTGTLIEANAWLERAMQLDPRFGRPALLHADRYAHILLDGPDVRIAGPIDVTPNQALERLRRSFDHAIRNSPDPYQRLLAEIGRELFAASWARLPPLVAELRRTEPIGELMIDDNWAPQFLSATGYVDAARAVAERSLRSDPLDGSSWNMLLQAETAAGNYDRAHAIIEEARRTVGDDPRLGRAEFYIAVLTGDRETAERTSNFEPFTLLLQGRRVEAFEQVRLMEAATDWPDPRLLVFYHEAGEPDRVRDLVRRMDALPAGPAMLARSLSVVGRALTFDPADAPNFTARMREAGADPTSIRRMPRLTAQSGGER